MNTVPFLRRFFHEAWDTLGLAALTSAFLVASFATSGAGSAIPRIVAVVTLVLVVLRLIQAAHRLRGPQPCGAPDAPAPVLEGEPESRRAFSAVLWLAGLLLSLLLLGTAVGAAAFCFVYLRWHAGERWPVSAAMALALGAGVHVVFAMLLNATLTRGLLL